MTGGGGGADANGAAVLDAYLNATGATYTDLWLALGDQALPAGTDAEHQTALFGPYAALLRQTGLWPTLGGEAEAQTADVLTQSGLYFDAFTLPRQGEAGGQASDTEAYYSFDYGHIHLISLDSTVSDRTPGSPMLTWLQNDLAQNVNPWVIAFWSHPPYSKGTYDSDAETALAEMRANVLPILEAGGVDLVMSSHSRAYERSVLLDGHYGTSDTLTAGDPGDGRQGGTGAYYKPSPGPAQHEGAVYVVMASSGQTGTGLIDHPAMVMATETLGSLVLDIDGNRMDARFLDGTGAVRDSFALHRGRRVAAASSSLAEDPTSPPNPAVTILGTPPAISTVTLAAVGDAKVKSTSPTKNYGTETTLRARAGSPAWRGFVQFDLSSITGTVTQATLRLYATDDSPTGGSFHDVADSWTESTITYASAPPLTNLITTTGAVSTGTWLELDVTATVAGNVNGVADSAIDVAVATVVTAVFDEAVIGVDSASFMLLDGNSSGYGRFGSSEGTSCRRR